MPMEEGPKVDRRRSIHEICEHVTTVRMQPDRQLVREVPDGLLVAGTEGQVRQLAAPQSGMQKQAEVSHLVALGGEPGHVTARENCVEQHEPFDCTGDRHGPPKTIVRLVNRLVQRMVLQMEDSGAGMGARVCGGVSIQDEAVEEIAGLTAVRDPGKGAVVTVHTDP
jgi:hypothetical protein